MATILSLIDIMDILFARWITDDTPGVLHELIKYHLTTFYPNQTVIPKMHLLVIHQE